MQLHRSSARSRFVALLACTWLAAGAAGAGVIEGVEFEDRIRVSDTQLVLYRTGLLRYRYIFKAYVAGLYLGEGVEVDAVLGDVPKRLEIHYFYGIKAGDFGKAAEQILARSFGPEELEPLRERIERLHAVYRDVAPGDRYALTYLPGTGTELSLNGKPLVTIPGSDFAAAYFAIWLGPDPADTSFRDQLLGRP